MTVDPPRNPHFTFKEESAIAVLHLLRLAEHDKTVWRCLSFKHATSTLSTSKGVKDGGP